MSDSLLDLGTVGLWDAKIDWGSPPTSDFDSAFVAMGAIGTIYRISDITDELPELLEATVKNLNKAAEYALIEKFVALQGQYARFWLPAPISHFTLKTVAPSGAGSLTVYYCGYRYKADRRIFILLKDGSRLTRKITAVVDDEEGDEQALSIDSALDRLIDPADVRRMSLLYLARLENDTLELQSHSIGVSEAKLKAIELVQEYSEV